MGVEYMIKLEGNVVEEYKIGNTKIQIRDSAYLDKSKKELERIINGVVNIELDHYYRESKDCFNK